MFMRAPAQADREVREGKAACRLARARPQQLYTQGTCSANLQHMNSDQHPQGALGTCRSRKLHQALAQHRRPVARKWRARCSCPAVAVGLAVWWAMGASAQAGRPPEQRERGRGDDRVRQVLQGYVQRRPAPATRATHTLLHSEDVSSVNSLTYSARVNYKTALGSRYG